MTSSMLARPKSASQKGEEARKHVAEARGYLSALLKKYGEAVDPASVEVKEIENRIAAAEKSIDPWLRGMAAAEKEKA